MARAPDQRVEQAMELYAKGLKLIEIAATLKVPEGTVRSWKNRYDWDATLHKKKRNVAKKKGGQLGNKNAEKYGFFSKYLPDETREIFEAIEQADPLDLLWHQIQIAYAAIVRAQRIAYVIDRDDKTIEKIEEKDGNVIGEKWEVQQAWDKQENFLKAQARAQGELRAMIKQYDDMLHADWESASEEQKARIEQIKANTERLRTNRSDGSEDEGVEIINDAPKETDPDIGYSDP